MRARLREPDYQADTPGPGQYTWEKHKKNDRVSTIVGTAHTFEPGGVKHFTGNTFTGRERQDMSHEPGPGQYGMGDNKLFGYNGIAGQSGRTIAHSYPDERSVNTNDFPGPGQYEVLYTVVTLLSLL
jgi:hypothetical protein